MNSGRIITVTVAILLSLSTLGFAQTSTISYQGLLSDAGTPANGTYQMEFRLLKANLTTQVGPTLSLPGVTVSQGVFTANLDFGSGANIFDGTERFIEVSVRRTASDPFTVLLPRQEVVSAPYSVRSKSSETASNANSLGGIPAANYLLTNGDGSGLSTLNASAILTGTLNDARLSANIPKLDAANAFTAANSFSGITMTGGGEIIRPRIQNSTIDPSLGVPPANAVGRVYYNTTDQSLKFFNGTTWNKLGNARNIVDTTMSGSAQWNCGFTGIHPDGQSVTINKLSATSRLRITYSDGFIVPASGTTVHLRRMTGAVSSDPLVPGFEQTLTASGGPPRLIGYASGLPAGSITIGVMFAGSGGDCTRLPLGRFLLEVEELP